MNDTIDQQRDLHTAPVDVTIVMVTYNAEEWTKRALAALTAGARNHTTELVVVDNASSEINRSDLLEWAGEHAVVKFLDENIGFGRACNLAAGMSKGRTVLLVNPDAVIDPGAIDALVDFLDERPVRGIVGGRITDPVGNLDYGSCFGHQTTWSLFCFATALSTIFKRNIYLNPEGLGQWQRDSVREVGIVTGCLLLADRSLWETLGGFDPRFFMYGEDADLCKRAWDLGFRPAVTPAAHAVHALGASSSSRVSKQILLFKGKVSLIKKSSSGLRGNVDYGLLLCGVGLRGGVEKITGKQSAGWLDLWRRRTEWSDGW